MTNNKKSIIIILGVTHALPSNLNYVKQNNKITNNNTAIITNNNDNNYNISIYFRHKH